MIEENLYKAIKDYAYVEGKNIKHFIAETMAREVEYDTIAKRTKRIK